MLLKKLGMLAVSLVMVFSVVGCDVEDSVGNLNIVTTVFPAYDFTRAIVGEDNVSLLLNPGADLHSFEPTPKDIVSIQDSDLFIYVGGELWVEDVLEGIDISKTKVIRLMDYVDLKEEELVEGMEHVHEEEEEDHAHEEEHDDHEHEEEHDDHEHDHASYDEHIWTSLRNAIILTEVIRDEVILLDTENANSYKDRTSEYVISLDQLDKEFTEMIDNAVRSEIIIGDKFPFRYFVDDYGLSYYAAFTGCSTASEASAQTIAFLIDKVEEDNIPVVFHTELSSEKITDTIVEETKTKKLELHSAHNLTLSDFESGKTYIDFMRDNYDNLKVALN